MPRNMVIKLATLNICFGLPNKKTIIKQIILQENIEVPYVQVTKISKNFDHNFLSLPGCRFESENILFGSSVGMYVNVDVHVTRRTDIEKS
jgi:hypothetical protein